MHEGVQGYDEKTALHDSGRTLAAGSHAPEQDPGRRDRAAARLQQTDDLQRIEARKLPACLEKIYKETDKYIAELEKIK